MMNRYIFNTLIIFYLLLFAIDGFSQRADNFFPCLDDAGNPIEGCYLISDINGQFHECVIDTSFCRNDSLIIDYRDHRTNDLIHSQTLLGICDISCDSYQEISRDTTSFASDNDSLLCREINITYQNGCGDSFINTNSDCIKKSVIPYKKQYQISDWISNGNYFDISIPVSEYGVSADEILSVTTTDDLGYKLYIQTRILPTGEVVISTSTPFDGYVRIQ